MRVSRTVSVSLFLAPQRVVALEISRAETTESDTQVRLYEFEENSKDLK